MPADRGRRRPTTRSEMPHAVLDARPPPPARGGGRRPRTARPARPGPGTPADSRQPVAAADLVKSPYRYVGRLIIASAPNSGGTGTLIGPRHVLTAAHVAVDLGGRAKRGGVATFVLPDGRSSEVTDAELDGGWRFKIFSCDFALLALKDELGAGGAHAAWAPFDDDKHLGKRMHVTGYDADLRPAATR